MLVERSASLIARDRNSFSIYSRHYLAFPLPHHVNQSGPKRCAPSRDTCHSTGRRAGVFLSTWALTTQPNPLTTSSISTDKFSTCFPQVSGVLFPLTLQSPAR